MQDTLDQDIINEFVGVAHGDSARALALLAQYPALANARAVWGETGIEAAAQMKQREIAEALLAAGAPLDICTASVFGMDDKVDEFIANDPNAAQSTGAHGITLLYYPVIAGNKELAERFYSLGSSLDAGAGGSTPLHGAAMFNQPEMATWLLDHGAAPEPLDYEGKTPLQVATDRGNTAVADAIQNHNATTRQN